MSERARVLFVGRPNSGKSSLFNRVTGQSAHVGNFPGITVDLLEATVQGAGGTELTIIDLPGLYSVERALDPATDEGIAAQVIRESGEDALLVQVLDVTQLALGLRLTRELSRLGRKLLVAVTQIDLLDDAGKTLDAEGLSRALGVPVVAVSARAPAAPTTLLEAIEKARVQPAPAPFDLEPRALAHRVLGPSPARVRERTRALDRWLLAPGLGPALFVLLMTAAFAAVFLVADPVTQVIDAAVGWATERVTALLGEGMLAGLVSDGILAGAGTVLIFMPQIVILTLVLEVLEASGYLARGAFLLDRLLRVFGLSGRAFLPLLMAHACAVPAIGSTRIIRDPKERLTTMLVLPLMACSARLPTYALLLGAFFSERSAWFRAGVFVFLYFAGIFLGAVAAGVIQRVVVRGRSLPLVLEMPLYRMPEARLVLRKAWQAARRFVRDVGTVIVVASAVLYVLLNVPVRPAASAEEPVIERSVAAAVGKTLEPLTRPAGFDWRIDVGLVGSFGARELMVGTMGVIMGVEDADDEGEGTASLAARLREAKRPDGAPLYTTATAASLLAFFVIACQCLSTVAALRRETRSWRWPAFVVGYTYLLAYGVAVVTYQVVGGLLG